jgi:hypothetical protein
MVNKYTAYEDEITSDDAAGPSTQDFDGTYLQPPVEFDETGIDEYHRFLALALKGGRADGNVAGDMRSLAIIDVDKILRKNIVLEINNDNAWGVGNNDTINYIGYPKKNDTPFGWFVPLASGSASEGKFWNESLTISAPVFINGRIVLATFQPDNTKSWVYNLPSIPTKDGMNVAGDEFQTGFDDTEFEGGATLTVNDEGKYELFIGSSDGSVESQDMGIEAPENGGALPFSGNAGTLYWKIRN